MPSVGEYIASGETVAVRTTASDSMDPTDSSKQGEIAATEERVVYSRGNYVADISLRSVNSVEYELPTVNTRYLASGFLFLAIGFLIWIVGPDFINESGLTTLLTATFGVIGLGFVISGLILVRHTLEIHTPSKSYEFNSKNSKLEDVAHAIRAHEP
ncbi:hypothetical protein [Salinarchaeum sp. Harcht-Bsk1]|uniref:hypothetical protein n=1 Tax=Salinarchaeum sp. Harcht-Bsk1 TaxID=1333523 RepID=UPI001181A18A|nr:hypothetical protein [Salinarchaeum sp. Harcht-Bsk1]